MAKLFALFEMETVLRTAGVLVAEVPGLAWKTNGHGEMGTIEGLVVHDTAGRLPPDDHPSLNTCIKGRPGLAGPLCNLFVARSGAFYPIAAGVAYHAGLCVVDGKVDRNFNAHSVGVECENHGVPGTDPWPEVQLASMAKGFAALAKHYGFGIAHVLGHKEVGCNDAGHLGRKIDPDFDCNAFRARVAAVG